MFYFFGIIEKELNDYKEMHNTKSDKKNHVTGIPAGKPNVLYSASAAYGTVSTLPHLINSESSLITSKKFTEASKITLMMLLK